MSSAPATPAPGGAAPPDPSAGPSGLDSISMFLGALAWGIQRWWPKKAEELTLASASGIMAGGSLAGILIIVLSRVLHVLVAP